MRFQAIINTLLQPDCLKLQLAAMIWYCIEIDVL